LYDRGWKPLPHRNKEKNIFAACFYIVIPGLTRNPVRFLSGCRAKSGMTIGIVTFYDTLCLTDFPKSKIETSFKKEF
jgi:hypothetical protein